MSDSTALAHRDRPFRLGLSGWAWALYEGGRDPYGNLVSVFIFAPYFTSVVVGDPVKGQVMMATMTTIYSLIVALTAPFLGAATERFGARKPLLFLITALMAPLIWSLWFVTPGGGGLSIIETLWVLGAIGILFVYSQVLHHSMLIDAAGPRGVRHASGLGLALANLFAVLALLFCLWAFALPGSPTAAALDFIPARPLFGINPATAEPSRIVAPIEAGLLALCAIPLFLFAPDAPRTGMGPIQAIKGGASELAATVLSLRGERDIGVFLLARMLFTDGMTSVVVFCGILAAGVMHWRTLEMLAFGIALASFACIGGLVGGWLDGLVGPKRAIQIEIGAALACLLAQLGMGRDRILYVWRYAATPEAVAWHGPVFRTTPELIYLAFSCGVALFVTAHYASSRTLLTRLAPADKLPALFGLYALSGTATVWLGSLLVKLATQAFHSQKAGFIPIALLLVLGFIGMAFVKGGGREARAAR
jgi:UMF1 family MFS transporter